MGRFLYTATIDQGIEDGLIEDDLGKGYLYFRAPAGDCGVVGIAMNQATVDHQLCTRHMA